MLSNPTTSLHARQRQHRRQNSTPSAFEGVKVPATTANASRRQAAGHRRGLSLDTRQQQQQQHQQASRQDSMVSMSTNNTGLANIPQHRVLREAQQQRTQTRPGPQQQQQQQNQSHYASMAQDDSENFLISPHDTPQTQRFDASCFDNTPVPFDAFGEQFNMMLQKNQGSYGTNMSSAKDFDLFSGESAQSTPSYMNFAESPSENSWNQDGSVATIRKTARRISNGIMDRVSKYENLGEETQRPSTPPNQNDNCKSKPR